MSLPLMVGVTILPILTAVRVSQDLRDGPRRATTATWVLPHTGRPLAPER